MTGLQTWQDSRKAQYNMEIFDDVLVKASEDFMAKRQKDGKSFFVWHGTTRMHVFTYIPPEDQAVMNAISNYNIEKAVTAQLDDSVGDLPKHLQDSGEADNTIVIFATDRGAEVFTWRDGAGGARAVQGLLVTRVPPWFHRNAQPHETACVEGLSEMVKAGRGGCGGLCRARAGRGDP